MLLTAQDRTRWDAELVDEGQSIVRALLRRNQPGPYQIQAAINAVHSDPGLAADTDWRQILTLYDQLYALTPTPVVALHRAVAHGEVFGPDAALSDIDGVAAQLGDYYLLHAIQADFLRRSGRNQEALHAFDAALAGVQPNGGCFPDRSQTGGGTTVTISDAQAPCSLQ